MARIIDTNKLESIKNTLVEIIIRDGASNASISKVAKQAKVSAGYLYRHYESKESLINELYLEKFEELSQILVAKIEKNDIFKDVIFDFFTEIILKVNEDEKQVLFLLKMMTDYSIEISEETRQKLKSMIKSVREKFNHEINENIESEQLYIQILGSILMFVNIRKRGVLKQGEITKRDIQLLTDITISALA